MADQPSDPRAGQAADTPRERRDLTAALRVGGESLGASGDPLDLVQLVCVVRVHERPYFRPCCAVILTTNARPLDGHRTRCCVAGWLRREHGVPQNSQWAIAAATRDRVDLGLRFTDPPVVHLLRVAYGRNP